MTGFLSISPLDLDLTLGCGQAHRWRKDGDEWKGVLGDRVVTLRQGEGGVYFEDVPASRLAAYLRIDDDVESIYAEISRADPLVKGLVGRYRGLRLLRQDPWECLATYLLATNANVSRIGTMVENVCREFGDAIDGGHAFPRPEQILDDEERLNACRLGYRCERLVRLARRVEDKEICIDAFRHLGYEECVTELKNIDGVGDKVADCVSLFAMDHLEAFPVDARIKRCLNENYGVDGNYRALSEFGRSLFGDGAGYAQEFLFQMVGDQRSLGQTQDGGR